MGQTELIYTGFGTTGLRKKKSLQSVFSPRRGTQSSKPYEAVIALPKPEGFKATLESSNSQVGPILLIF